MQDTSLSQQIPSGGRTSPTPQRSNVIAVIADDFTGAAEIGGVALRHGFKTLVSTCVITDSELEVLVVATNTREESPELARQTIADLTIALSALHPVIIYKKIDSVLRGNVVEELKAQLTFSKKQRALIIPANPSLDRKIKNGIYYYQGAPLKRLSFSVNSKDESTSSHVVDLLGRHFESEIAVVSKGDDIPNSGMIIGNTVNDEDLNYWAKITDSKTILAGGSGFFDAFLKTRTPKTQITKQISTELPGNKLFVCGSAFEQSRRVVAEVKNRRSVVYMPSKLFCDLAEEAQLISAWRDEIVARLNSSNAVIIAVNSLECGEMANLPERIGIAFGDVVKSVVEQIKVHEILIEGGQTALALVEKLGYQQFSPVQELALGVIRLKVKQDDSLFLTLKPGSYKWPDKVWAG